jgi:hypothetical protein
MNVDPNQEVTITVPAGHVINALAALSKQPYEQVVATVRVLEEALTKAVAPPAPQGPADML